MEGFPTPFTAPVGQVHVTFVRELSLTLALRVFPLPSS